MNDNIIIPAVFYLGKFQHSRFKSIDQTTNSAIKKEGLFSIRNDLSNYTNQLSLVNLYRKIVILKLLYGCESWNNLKEADLQVFNKFQQLEMKDIQGFKISTRSDMCESMLGIYPIISEIDISFREGMSINRLLNKLYVTTRLRNGGPKYKLTQTSELF